MDVHFQQVTKKDTFVLHFNEDSTVKDAKEELKRSQKVPSDVPSDKIKLLFKSKILQDAALLKDMQTTDKSPISFYAKSQPSATTTQDAKPNQAVPPAQPSQPTQPSPSAQPPQTSPFAQPPQTSPSAPPPQASPSAQPPQTSPFEQPSQQNQFSQQPQSSPFSPNQPPPFSQPPQFSQPSQPFQQPSSPSLSPQGAQPFSQGPTNEPHVPLQQSRPVYDVDHPLIINENDPQNPYQSLTKEKAIEMLTEMGYEREQCLEALRLTKGIVNYASNLLAEGDVSEQGLAKIYPSQESSLDRQKILEILEQISNNPAAIQAVRNGQAITVSINGNQVPIQFPAHVLNEYLNLKNSQMYGGMGAGMGGNYGGMNPGMGAGMGAGMGGNYGGMNPGMGGNYGGMNPGMGAGMNPGMGGSYGGMNPGMGAGMNPGMGAGMNPGMGAGMGGNYGGMNPGMGAGMGGNYGAMNPGMGAGMNRLSPQEQAHLQQYQREVATLLSQFSPTEQAEIKQLISEGNEPLNVIQLYFAADKDINATRELLKTCVD